MYNKTKYVQVLVAILVQVTAFQGCQSIKDIINSRLDIDNNNDSSTVLQESTDSTSGSEQNSNTVSQMESIVSDSSSISDDQSESQLSPEEELQKTLEEYMEKLKAQSTQKVTVENNRDIQYGENGSLIDMQNTNYTDFNKSCVDFTQADKVINANNSKVDIKLSWEGNYDFDLIAWQLGRNGEFDLDAEDGDFIFYNNLKSSNADIQIMSDLRNNGTEVASMDLSTVRNKIDNILVDISYYTESENENFENSTLQVYVDGIEYIIYNLEEYVKILNSDTNTAQALLIHRDEETGDWVVYNNLGKYAFSLREGCTARGIEVE